jgi:hypothetical protein
MIAKNMPQKETTRRFPLTIPARFRLVEAELGAAAVVGGARDDMTVERSKPLV